MIDTFSGLSDVEILRVKLWSNFLAFCQVFYPVLTGREFIIENPPGRKSHHLIIAEELKKVSELETLSLLINVQPGSGKSTLLQMFVAWTMSRWPDSNYIYIAFGHDLAASNTAQIKRIISSSTYRAIFDVHLSSDSKAKDYFQTTMGGTVRAFGSGGPVTGANAGYMTDEKRFTGALICFPADEVVHTESGLMKIGDIVKNRLKTKVWSRDLETGVDELRPIVGWYENPGSEIVEIGLSDGTMFRCTPDHNVWTDNRGWVEAQDLLTSDAIGCYPHNPSPPENRRIITSDHLSCFSIRKLGILKNIEMLVTQFAIFKRVFFSNFFSAPVLGGRMVYSKHGRYFCGRNSSVSNNLLLLFRQITEFSQVSIGSISFGDAPPSFTSPNLMYNRHIYTEHFSNGFCAFTSTSSFSNIERDCFSQFSAGTSLVHREGPMSFGVLDVFRLGAVTKVIKRIISAIAVEVPHLNSFFLGTNKGLHHKLMDLKLFNFGVSAKRNSPISSSSIRQGLLQKLFFDRIKLSFPSRKPAAFFDNALFASDSSLIRDRVKPFPSGDRAPLFVRKIGHVDKTYCINVEHNHNFIVGSMQGCLVSNCDDLTKPDEASSQTIRESILRNYQETILQRPRGPHVPMICIAQRLHEDDICSHMLSGNDERKWKHVCLKSLDEAENALCPSVTTKEQLLEKKQKSPYSFFSQYMQEPVPAGGALFKRENFVMLDEEPEILATFITADTAETSKSYNDATAFSFWGLYKLQDEQTLALHWLDAWEIWCEPKDLQSEFTSFYTDCMRHKVKPRFAAIEKKSTGVTLISILQDMRGLEIKDIKRDRSSGSKTERFLECQPYIASKLISFTAGAKHASKCIQHMTKITANDSHARDDLADTCADAIRIALIDKLIYLGDNEAKTKQIAKNLANDFNRKLKIISNARTHEKW